MNEIVKEIYKLMEKRTIKRFTLIVVFMFGMGAVVSSLLGITFLGVRIADSTVNDSTNWWLKEVILWVVLSIAAYVIGTIWDIRYVARCFAPCYDFLYKECDVYKLMEVTQTGVEYGKDKKKKSDRFAINYFETLYVVALNTNWEYERAISYLTEEWKS